MGDIYTVPGVTVVHPRSEWVESNYPILGPVSHLEKITQGVAHYTAAPNVPDGDPGESLAQIPGLLRAMQRDYVQHRGYSLGYWWCVDWTGGAWQIRGWEYQSAANDGRAYKNSVKAGHPDPSLNANGWTAPILFLVDGQDRLTPAAVATGKALWAECQRLSGRLLNVVPHSALDLTGCPGDGIRKDIDQSLLTPGAEMPPKIGDEMIYIVQPVYAGADANTPWLAVFDSGAVRRATNTDVAYAKSHGVATIPQDSREQHEYQVARYVS